MTHLDFICNGKNIRICCNLNDKMENIFKKYILEAKIDENSVFFLYDGKRIDEKLELKDIINNKKENEIKILVSLKDELEKEKNISVIESKYIICPECRENIRIRIDNYKIKLYDCYNGHQFNNILLEEYDNTQKIDLNKIKCDKCKDNNKSNTKNNEFYICLTCKMNICPLCKTYFHTARFL